MKEREETWRLKGRALWLKAFDVDGCLGGDEGEGDGDGDGGGINGDDAAWSRRRRSYVFTIVMVPVQK